MLSSGPCKKFSESPISYPYQGRSLRSHNVKVLINNTLNLIHQRLELPQDYRVCFTPGSNTGAMEMALWNLIGPRSVKVYVTDPFSRIWATDIMKLGIKTEVCTMEYGHTPTLDDFNASGSKKPATGKDIVFVLNQTASGCYHRNLDWIPDNRWGLSFADATSIAFADYIDWSKLDVVSLSFQKVLGGEAGVGILVLSPAAITRLQSYIPTRPIPNLLSFRNADGSIRWNIFEDFPINTLSVATIWEAHEILKRHTLQDMHNTCVDNYNLIKSWVDTTLGVDFLITDEQYRSWTVQCLIFRDMTSSEVKAHIERLQNKEIYDISPYPGLPGNSIRIWTGPTVTIDDLKEFLNQWHM